MTKGQEDKRVQRHGGPASGKHRVGTRGARSNSAGRPSGTLIAIVALVAIVVVGGAIALSARQGTASRPPVSGLITETAAKGPADAKVTITEYSDFQCPYCGQFARGTERQIDEAYVLPGKVRFLYRNRILIGDESVWAGEAAYCAGEQGRFWDYHDKLFESQNGENRGTFSKPNLKRFANTLGLDGNSFGSCLDSDRYAQQVRAESVEGQRRGIQATPGFFVNNTKLDGALPFQDFKAAIEAELRRAQ